MEMMRAYWIDSQITHMRGMPVNLHQSWWWETRAESLEEMVRRGEGTDKQPSPGIRDTHSTARTMVCSQPYDDFCSGWYSCTLR